MEERGILIPPTSLKEDINTTHNVCPWRENGKKTFGFYV